MEKNKSNQYRSQLITLKAVSEYIQINISTDVLNGGEIKVLLYKSNDGFEYINFKDSNLNYDFLDFDQTVEFCLAYYIDKGYILEN